MRLIKLTVEIRYPHEKPELLRFREKIISTISKGEKQNIPNFNEGFQFLIKNKGTIVVIDSVRMGADIILSEDIPNATQYSQDNMIKLFKQLNSLLNIKNIKRIGVRSQWIQGVDMDIKKLISKFKTVFYKDTNELVGLSQDVGLSFTLKDGENTINYNAGPMDVEQVSEILNINSKAVAKTTTNKINKPCIFVDYDYFLNKEMRYSDALFINFVEKALENTKKNVIKTLKLMEVKNV